MIDHAIATAVHNFTAEDYDAGRLPFLPHEYAQLKYGDDAIAKRYGYELADSFFARHYGALIVEPVVVIPSPYNFVENAATLMTKHFVSRLNHLLVHDTGIHVDYATIQRKLSYTSDYGHANAEARRALIAGDKFFIHQGFFENKTLLFIDDVRITGAHEDRLLQLLDERPKLRNANIHFLYYAMLCGDKSRNDIEASINNSSMTLDKFIEMQRNGDNQMIVRPIKWLLRLSPDQFKYFLNNACSRTLTRLYNGCLGEGYYSVPDYQPNFHALMSFIV